MGPLIAAIIIVVLLIVGGVYMFQSRTNTPNTSPVSPTAPQATAVEADSVANIEAAVPQMTAPQITDDLAKIQKDLAQ